MKRLVILGLLSVIFGMTGISQGTETLSAGAFIVDMGEANQTNANALRPYGLIYALTKNLQVPVKWVINPNKGKDQNDFVYNGRGFRGGPFIIPAEFRNTAVNNLINSWVSSGVRGVTTTSPITVPVYATIRTAVRWTLDDDNGKIAEPFFSRAGIPSSAYDRTKPRDLDACNDIFVMPHADPTASSHGNLVTWNLDNKGSIWLGCKAGSELENRVGKFLSTSGLVPTKHDDLKGTASYDYPADPVMQFLGTGLHNETRNGAEQIYIPRPTWRPTTRVGIYQTNTPSPSTRRAILVYGRGFGDNNRGWVNMTAGHNIAKKNNANSVAAIRAFFNFSLLAAIDKTFVPSLQGVPSVIFAGTGTPISYTMIPFSSGFSTQWSSSCGGTFSPSATATNVTFTPPAGATSCVISVRISDACGRVFFDSKQVTIQCQLDVTRSVSDVSCSGNNNGAINMTITGSPGPYTWNWTRVSPAGTGSGSGSTISGLRGGTYNVTVTSAAGCQNTFTSLVGEPNALTATPVVTSYTCFGQTGSISLTVNGGNPGYSYAWTGPSGFTSNSRDISGLLTGSYTVTVTDTKGCTAVASGTVTGPTAAVAIGLTNKTNVSCNGGTNGSITIAPSGGTPGYSYTWSDGSSSQNRTNLPAGIYSVTVTDINGCTASRTEEVTQPGVLTIAVNKTDPTCPPGAVAPVNSDGVIDITVTGGTGPYTYAWSTTDGAGLVAGAQDQSGLRVGTYSVTVTDANGCVRTLSVTLLNILPIPTTPSTISDN